MSVWNSFESRLETKLLTVSPPYRRFTSMGLLLLISLLISVSAVPGSCSFLGLCCPYSIPSSKLFQIRAAIAHYRMDSLQKTLHHVKMCRMIPHTPLFSWDMRMKITVTYSWWTVQPMTWSPAPSVSASFHLNKGSNVLMVNFAQLEWLWDFLLINFGAMKMPTLLLHQLLVSFFLFDNLWENLFKYTEKKTDYSILWWMYFSCCFISRGHH